jgi:hypothetical protein
MKSVAPKFPQRLAEDEICCACDGLSAPQALGALLEIVAQILADEDIVPGTDDFESFMNMIAKSLPARVAQLRWETLLPRAERQRTAETGDANASPTKA